MINLNITPQNLPQTICIPTIVIIIAVCIVIGLLIALFIPSSFGRG